ncbi:phytanoyl-CoA dioxygenase family protein [Polynucleobacter sp. es-EL-1]|uniref:phytanoyl-CoA dioxygenase family protein n=1 Tax=Polynucleobacter sp. es-EL-1 TaxID=1855652 RepID=UPI001BFE48C7|nr:phytanoyl-CoA dioxygenase family protein [Polynucleobacter sp. es-EL-1]QWE10876.1 phytanoyl-CoA dioxygenase family protein [Polynucleobacter sp. es-EL-1]
MMNQDCLAQFKRDGYLLLEDIISNKEIHEIKEGIDTLAKNLVANTDYGDNPFLFLANNDRPLASKVFDALIKLPVANRFFYSERLESIAKFLLDTDFVLSAPSQMNIRADHPGESKFLYPWHDDWSYNGSSVNSLIYWIPLQDVDNENGCLHIIPASHLHPRNVYTNMNALTSGNSADYFKIKDIEEIIRILPEIRVPLKLRQGVVFHSKLLHKSGVNSSKATRLAIQSRWYDGNFFDAIADAYQSSNENLIIKNK